MVSATCDLRGFCMRKISLELLIRFSTGLRKHHHVLPRTSLEGQIFLLENQEFDGGDKAAPGKFEQRGGGDDDRSLGRGGDGEEKIFPGHHEGDGATGLLEHRRSNEDKRSPEQTRDAGKPCLAQCLECCTGFEGLGPSDLQQCLLPPGGHLC